MIDEIATVLDINYDAAYRRVNGRTQLSLEESVILAKHYNISLNDLFKVGDPVRIIMTKTVEVNNAQSLEEYFKRVNKHLTPLEFNKAASIFYGANELPIFYILRDNSLFRFKLFVWLQILDKDSAKNISFKNFSFPESLIETALETGRKYDNVKISEMWSDGIINNTLNQISYFYEINLLEFKEAIEICNNLTSILKDIEKSCHTGKREIKNSTPFKLFSNEVMNLNNNILIKNGNQKILFAPYTLHHYYMIEDQVNCDMMDDFFNKRRLLSKQITNSGIKNITLFFKPKFVKINNLLKRLKLLNEVESIDS
ncbi:MAG: hypothetical protein V3U80_05610 [Flavobacteriaceae bacterium]